MGTATVQETDAVVTDETPARPEPVQLRTRRDFSLTVIALEDRKETLKKLAKGAREEGYINEARVMEGDLAAIEGFILPQFREQRDIPLVTPDNVRAMVRDALHRLLHRFAVESDQGSKSTAHADTLARRQGKRETELAEKVAVCVERYVLEVAAASYAAGLAARELTPAHLAMRASGTLHDAAGSL